LQISSKNAWDGFWFEAHERNLLSMYFNGIVRNPKNKKVSPFQEFGVWQQSKDKWTSRGRCDGFIKINKSAIYVEAKKYKNYLKYHWDYDIWKTDDKKILQQLENYYDAEKNELGDFYQSHYLMTISFHAFQFKGNTLHEFLKKYTAFYNDLLASKKQEKWYSYFIYSDSTKKGLEIYGMLQNKNSHN